MTKTNKLFRFIWRVNAILILVATAAVTLGAAAIWMESSGYSTTSAPVVGVQDTGKRLSLAQMTHVSGSNVIRQELVERDTSAAFSSSGGYGQTRNFLFVDTKASSARWLLPDDDHVVTEHSDVETRREGLEPGRMVGTFALVKESGPDMEASGGRLLLFDPTGLNVHEVSAGVRDLQAATINQDGMLTVLFERDRKYVLALF
jgi:hypothetical protein